MHKLLIVGVAVLSFVGCMSTPETPPPNFNDIPVAVAAGKSLKDVIVTSATQRSWFVSEISPNKLRCTILQRSNKVEIDVIVQGQNAYSIQFVSSNIPQKKYLQWVGNLQREIAKNAR